ncbi:ATP/GTP-binding protein [Nocardia sp. NPDC058658]|uniref:GTP-binding protein n=1 Tax=Nocardia sp. NPDC058658 TaxID=3346580 RepID=UPI00364A0732
MESGLSDTRMDPPEVSLDATTLKILISGGFGVGKTTLVGTISEVTPLRTEETMTAAGVGVDDLSGVGAKTTTTVALDFGRITIADDLVLYLFGMPGQQRFWFMWNEMTEGALGAVVLADTRRLDGCFAAIDFFERRGIPFIVGVNCFDGVQHYTVDAVRTALDLTPTVPILLCDVRDLESTKHVLVNLLTHAMSQP